MTLDMYYGIRENNLYWRTSHIIITARGRGPRPDLFYQISVYYYIEDLHTAAEFDFRQPRILDLYQDLEYKRVNE
eukprot:SAG11_NODE_236_length_11840_cov_6.566051_7_plen_75_part_00